LAISKKAAHIAWLAPVEKEIRLLRVAADSILPLQQVQRDKRVEKIAGRAIVQAEPLGQRSKIGPSLGEFGE